MKWMMALVFVSALLISNVVGEIDTEQLKTEVERELPELSYHVDVYCEPPSNPNGDGSVYDRYDIRLIINNDTLANDRPQANEIVDMLLEAGVRVASRYPADKFRILGSVFWETSSGIVAEKWVYIPSF
jgi:hypothetical protein